MLIIDFNVHLIAGTMIQLNRLIIVLTYFFYVEASDSGLLSKMTSYREMEQNTADTAYNDQLQILNEEHSAMEKYYLKFKNIYQNITDELEYEEWSSNLFLNNIDLNNNKIFFQNGSCRHNSYQEYKNVHEHYLGNVYVHPSRLVPIVAKINALIDEEVKFLRTQNEKLKISLTKNKNMHDKNMDSLDASSKPPQKHVSTTEEPEPELPTESNDEFETTTPYTEDNA